MFASRLRRSRSQRHLPRAAVFVLALTPWAFAQAPPTTPLTELGGGTYLGFPGGLYPGGSNEIPAAHLAVGLAHAAQIQPLDTAGRPSAGGKIVLLSIGMSNTTQEFCSAGGQTCESWSFAGQAAADPAVNHTTLALVNGARGGQTASTWSSPTAANYDSIRDGPLARAGLTEAQVQAAWVKVANAGPTRSLPDENADAYALVRFTGSIARALRSRYPNLRLVFLSSRIYAGYATSALNPEPYAYESGLGAKWAIEAQIRQAGDGTVDPRAGDLAPGTAAPWLGWGPYLWGNGATPRADGLVWLPEDFQSDGTHPSTSGERKVGALLLEHFKSHPATRGWFLAEPPQATARLVIPTVASAPGLLGSYFRTSLQLHNPSTAVTSGRLVFHPTLASGSDRDPARAFSLAPGETRSFADLLATLGVSGVGSLDVLVDSGEPPLALARVFNDAGEAGTTGASEEGLAAGAALSKGESGVLLVPADLVGYRLNVGVRSLEEGAALRVTVRSAAGGLLGTVERSFPPTTHAQESVAAFLQGLALWGGESLTVTVTSGSAFVFGATADNRSQDPSLQVLRGAR